MTETLGDRDFITLPNTDIMNQATFLQTQGVSG